MLLADLGATIIKIENPKGDSTRDNGPYLSESDKGCRMSGYNISVNRNKYNICLNLKTPEGQKIAHELVKKSDALIFNFSSPKVMEKFDLDYETVKKLNPAIVYVSVSGYGSNQVVKSLHESKPTVDLMMQAESGAMSITGAKNGQIYKFGPGIGDSCAGAMAAVALLAGIMSSGKSGKGQFVDIAMLDSMILLTERIIYQYSYTGTSPGPEGNGHPLQAPYSIYPAKDGYVCICGTPAKYWERLCNAMGVPQYLEDTRFADQHKRRANENIVNKIITEWTQGKTKKEIMEILDGHECLASPVNTAKDLFEDEHVRAREMIVEVEGDPITNQKVQIAGTPFKFSDTKTKIRHRSALLGENSEQILIEILDYSDEDVSKLIDKGVVIANSVEKLLSKRKGA
jgi:crotonobetainyl-CoA:carnitine CoA-transferase CaiB-like acyl-CoA transferase